MDNLQHGLTAEAKAAMMENLQLEIDARKEKLRAQCEAQCASLQSRLERRVNRIPVTKRQMFLMDLLNASLPVQPAPVKAAPKSTYEPRLNCKISDAPSRAPATRKTRAAPATSTITIKPAVHHEETKPMAKATITKAAPKAKPVKETKATRGKKRGSDEVSGEDKENAAELAIPKKRVRAAPTPKVQAATKPAATTRTTRAASRTKAAPSQVLSPKNDNANARSKPAARSVRPR